MVRQSISLYLNNSDDIEVIAEAKSGEEACKLIQKITPDIVLMDVRMPGIGGLEATRRILAHRPKTKIIGLTGYNDGSYPAMFVKAGAQGYITKDTNVDDMIAAIRQVHDGEPFLSPKIAHRIIGSENQKTPNPFDELSDRELQIALMVVECYKTNDIAEQLNLSPKTVNSYKYRVFEKLNLQSDIELMHMTLRFGMLDTQAIDKE